jgi:uncharacterized membrane protein
MTRRLRTGIAFGIGIAVFFILKDLLFSDNALTSKAIIKSVAAALITGAIATFIIWLFTKKSYNPENDPIDQ